MRPIWLVGIQATLFVTLLISSPVQAQVYGWVKVAQLPRGLCTLEVVDSMHLWTSDRVTGFYYSKDGGITWYPGSGATVIPYSISMYDTSTGWAAGWDGSNGAVFKTTDGGLSWAQQIYSSNRHYLGTATLTSKRNVTVGNTYNFFPDTGKILRTTNGGANWIETTRLDSGHASGFNKLFFLDSLHGWISGGADSLGPAVWKTTDGGISWAFYPAPQDFYGLAFVDTARGWGTYSSTVYRTTDAGVNWQFAATVQDTDPTVGPDLFIEDLSFVDSINGWAYGYIFYHGIISEGIYRTTNGGLGWFRESIGLTPDFGDAAAGKMLGLNHGWAVCGDGSVLRYALITDAVERLPELPSGYSLSQNYPNPFNPLTNIIYEVPNRSYVAVKVYDETGKLVAVLVDQDQEPGTYKIHFDGSSLASGVYHYSIRAGTFNMTKEMLLTK